MTVIFLHLIIFSSFHNEISATGFYLESSDQFPRAGQRQLRRLRSETQCLAETGYKKTEEMSQRMGCPDE